MDTAEKISVTSEFVLDAPPGELTDVVADIQSLTADEPEVVDGINSALERYNKEQLALAKLPGASDKVVVSEYNELEKGRFFDPGSSSSFLFDHATQKASGVQTYTLESKNEDTVKSLLRDLGPYVKEHFPSSPSFGVYPYENDTQVAIVIVANKYSPSNFWNGRWRSTYIYDPASSSLEGTIKVDVHYYEDGNVRLQTNKKVSGSRCSTVAAIVKAIGVEEKKYQEELNKAFAALSEGAFKALRRQLPITKQKINWDTVNVYRVGQDIGGGRSR